MIDHGASFVSVHEWQFRYSAFRLLFFFLHSWLNTGCHIYLEPTQQCLLSWNDMTIDFGYIPYRWKINRSKVTKKSANSKDQNTVLMVDFLEKRHFFVLEKILLYLGSIKLNFQKFCLKNPAEIISAEILKISPKLIPPKFFRRIFSPRNFWFLMYLTFVYLTKYVSANLGLFK